MKRQNILSIIRCNDDKWNAICRNAKVCFKHICEKRVYTIKCIMRYINTYLFVYSILFPLLWHLATLLVL